MSRTGISAFIGLVVIGIVSCDDRGSQRETAITANLEDASGHIDNAADALMKNDNAGALVEVTQARVYLDKAYRLQSPSESNHDPYESARK